LPLDGGEKHNHGRYDTLNRLQTLTPQTAFSGTASFGFSYDGLSRRTQMTRPNSRKSVYAYDNLSRLLMLLHQRGSTTLGKCGTSGSISRRFWRLRSQASPGRINGKMCPVEIYSRDYKSVNGLMV
jgi:hypothetical protein